MERRGGVGEKAQSDEIICQRVRRWKGEAAKMGYLVKEKKEKCWRRFCEEHGEKDPWEVIRWAKDPLRIKEKMKRLYNREGEELLSDEEKVRGLIGDIFGQEEVEEICQDNEGMGRDRSSGKHMEELVRTVL